MVSRHGKLTDKNGPAVDKDEESDVCEFMKREDEGEDMVRQTLRITIERVERVAGVGCGHNPLVVRLVETLVDQRMMKSTMNQVDETIRERDEQRELEVVVPAWHFIGV